VVVGSSILRTAVAIVVSALATTIHGCAAAPSVDKPQTSLAPRANRTLQSDDLVQAIGSLGRGGDLLVPWLTADAWWIHHGSTGMLRGRGPIAEYLESVAAAFPRLGVRVGTPAHLVGADAGGFLVEAVVLDRKRGTEGRWLALIRIADEAIASIEVFGDDLRELPDPAGAQEEVTPVGTTTWQLEAAPGVAAQTIAAFVESRERDFEVAHSGEATRNVRWSAASDGGSVGMTVWTAQGSDEMPIVRHIAAVVPTNADNRLYFNRREGTSVTMGNIMSSARELRSSELESESLHWGAPETFCCSHAPHSRECRLVSAQGLSTCNAHNRPALVCRQAYHCRGDDCFCCANGLEAACDMEGAKVTEKDLPPPSRRPPAPTVWSPY